MATISYKCDTCKRAVELVENSQGFTVFGKCVITSGCAGRLYRTERNPNNVRESAPLFVSGLDNYVPRRAFHTFTQGLLADKWNVAHGLGTTPAIFVYELTDGGETIPLDNSSYTVKEVDKNNITLTFTRRIRGIVHSVARSTVPTVPSVVELEGETVQASSKGIITFAIPKYLTQVRGTVPETSSPVTSPGVSPTPTPTPSASMPISLCTSDKLKIEIEIIRPNEQPFVCFEEIPYKVDNRSPWSGWNEILVRKRRNYCIRTSEILSWKIFGGAELTKNDIPNGTRIRFLRIEYNDNNRYLEIPSRALLMLLAQEPHEYADKIKDQVIDVGELIGDTPNYFVYEDGEIYLEETKVEKTYPDISRSSNRPPVILIPSPTPTPSVTRAASPTPAPTSTLTPTPTVTPSPQPFIFDGNSIEGWINEDQLDGGLISQTLDDTYDAGGI